MLDEVGCDMNNQDDQQVSTSLSSKKRKHDTIIRARHARLAAVQAIYQQTITAIDPEELISEFLDYRLNEEQDSTFSLKADSQLFTDIVRGFCHHHTEIDSMISSVLSPSIIFKRLELLIQSILRAGTLELLIHKELPKPIILDEYITIAKAFFNGRESAMINGILHAIVHRKNLTDQSDMTKNHSLSDLLKFNEHGMIPAIAQQYDTNEVLMVGWMNTTSINETLSTGFACYWSRSRDCLWRKGETSGHWQSIVEIRIDCDGDTLLLLVDQKGVACHTGHHSCFYRAWHDQTLKEIPIKISQ